MKAFWVLARMRVLDVLRSRSSAVFVLVFPVMLLGVVGLVFRDGHPFERRTVVLVGAVPSGVTEPLSRYEEVRTERAASEEHAVAKLRAKMASAAFVSAPGTEDRLLVGPRDHIFGRGLLEVLPPGVVLEPVAAPRWGYVHYLFPGVLALSVMLAGLFATGYTMVLYRQNRFLKKLATTPIAKGTFVAELVSGRGALVVGQVALLTLSAWLLFDVPLTLGSGAAVLGISLAGLLAFMGIGFVLACVVRTEDLVVDIVSAVNIPLVFLSEIFFPLDALPAPLRLLGAALPSTAVVRLTRDVALYGVVDPAALGAGLGIIAAWAVASFALSARLFRWHE